MHGNHSKYEKPEKAMREKRWVHWILPILSGAILGFFAGLLLAVTFGVLGWPFDYGQLMVETIATGMFTLVVVFMIFE